MNKTMKFFIKTVLAVAMLLPLTGCSDDDVTPGGGDDDEVTTFDPRSDASGAGDFDAGIPYSPDDVNVTLGETEDILLEDFYGRIISEKGGSNDPDDEAWVKMAEEGLSKMDSVKQALLDETGANATVEEVLLSVAATRYEYQSIDANGQAVTLSGVFVYPRNYVLFWTLTPPRNIIMGCHVTICSDKECPSNFPSWLAEGVKGTMALATDVGMLALHASSTSTCSLVIMPDYEGYGVTKDRAHPYLYQSVTARQVLDGISAGIRAYEKYSGYSMGSLNSISVGYSQGGSVSMAVHKYIDTHGLASTYNYLGSVCGDGPYDPLGHMMQYVKDGVVNMPCVLPLIIKGMVDANPYIKGSYTAADFMSADLIASGALDDIASKQYTTDDINDRIKAYSKAHGDCLTNSDGVCTFEKMVTPGLYKYFTGQSMKRSEAKPYIALAKALELNNLTTNWTPTVPMVCFHSVGDEVVPYCNFESAYSAFGSTGYFRGIRYDAKTYTHVGTGRSFYLLYEGSLVKGLFSGKWKNWSVLSTQTGI